MHSPIAVFSWIQADRCVKFGSDACYWVSDALVVEFRHVPNDLCSFQDSILFCWLSFLKFYRFKFQNYFLVSVGMNNIISKAGSMTTRACCVFSLVQFSINCVLVFDCKLLYYQIQKQNYSTIYHKIIFTCIVNET